MSSAVAAIDAAFLEIRALTGVDRAAALARLTDPAIRAEVESLLAHDVADAFIRAPRTLECHEAPGEPAILGAVLSDRYEVQLLTAEGGFGWVFRGYDRQRPGPVAIKLFKPGRDRPTDAEADMARERQVLTALADESVHIVAYRGAGGWIAPDGARLPYLVMEWLDGPTLRAWLRDAAPDGMPLAAAIERLEPIAEALAAAHAQGVAHRDLKPTNIMCVGDRAAPVLKLVDFGAAKLAADRAGGFDSTTTRVGALTIEYAAPEQFDKTLGPSGPRSDVYALALLLVELSAGRSPWGSPDLFALAAAIGDPKARPTPRACGITTPDAVDAVFKAALAVNPDRRPASVGMFWSALCAALHQPDARWRRLLRRGPTR